MNFDLLRWAFELRNLKPVEQLVLLQLIRHQNTKTGVCNPSVGRLAACTNLTVRSVRRHLSRLIESGAVVQEIRGAHLSANYRFLCPDASGQVSLVPAIGGTNPSALSDPDRTDLSGLPTCRPDRIDSQTGQNRQPDRTDLSPKVLKEVPNEVEEPSRRSPGVHGALFGAIVEVTKCDPALSSMAKRIGALARELQGAGYQAGDIAAFGDWWFGGGDFRGDRGEPPDLEAIRKRIGQAKACGWRAGKAPPATRGRAPTSGDFGWHRDPAYIASLAEDPESEAVKAAIEDWPAGARNEFWQRVAVACLNGASLTEAHAIAMADDGGSASTDAAVGGGR